MTDYRKRIKGICKDIVEGKADDEEPEALMVEKVENIIKIKDAGKANPAKKRKIGDAEPVDQKIVGA